MGYYVHMRRNGTKVGELGPFTTQKLAIKQAQPFADDAAPGIVVSVEPQAKRKKAKRNPTPVDDWEGETRRPRAPRSRQRNPGGWIYVEYTPGDNSYSVLGPWETRAEAGAGKRSSTRRLKSTAHAWPGRKLSRIGRESELATLKREAKAKAKKNPRRRNGHSRSQVPGTPPIATTLELVDWSPMNQRTAATMRATHMAPRANPKRQKLPKLPRTRRSRKSQLKLF